MASDNIFQPTLVKREAPYRGKTSSADYNDFQDEVFHDLHSLASVVNGLYGEQVRQGRRLAQQDLLLHSLIWAARQEKAAEDLSAAKQNSRIVYTQSFRRLDDLLYTNIPESRQLRIEPLFGQATLPINGIVHRFYAVNPITQDLFLPTTLEVSVTAVDEGTDGVVSAGSPKLAFDGKQHNVWERRISFPASSDRTFVTCQMNVTVPVLFASQSNRLTLVPTVPGSLDILSILYSTTQAAPSIALPGFTATNGIGPSRWYFAPLNVTKLRLQLRQRHFTEDDGQKVFTTGLNELLLDLVEFDRTKDQATVTDHNSAVFKVDAPSGYYFNRLYRFLSTPDYKKVAGDQEINYQIFDNANLSGSPVWDSFTSPDMASVSVNVGPSNKASLWVVLLLEHDDNSDVTPVVQRWSMEFDCHS